MVNFGLFWKFEGFQIHPFKRYLKCIFLGLLHNPTCLRWGEMRWIGCLTPTINDILVIYVTVHRCAGGLKKTLDIRSGPPLSTIPYLALLRRCDLFFDFHFSEKKFVPHPHFWAPSYATGISCLYCSSLTKDHRWVPTTSNACMVHTVYSIPG